jgi:hypothetical protein
VSSTPTITGAAQPASPLERSRARSSEARSSLEAAHLRLSHLDGELGRNAARSTSDETALRSAMDEIKRLKKSLKDGEKQRRKLVTARKRAADAAAKAEEKARKAEAKYDRAVLADMIQRTKEHDRRTASAKAPENGSAATPAVAAMPDGPADAPVPAVDGAEPEDLGTTTARQTAARTTARRASPARTATTPRPRTSRTPSAEA